MIFKNIVTINAKDIPTKAMDWLIYREVKVHGGNDIVQVEDNGNDFAEWLKAAGFVFEYHKGLRGMWAEIGIFGT